MNDTLLTIFLLFVLGIFAWFGYTRMFLGMLAQFGMLVLAAAVGNPNWLGDTVIRIINRMYMLTDMMLNGGFQLIAGGEFSADKFGEIFAVAKVKPPLIPPQNEEIILFVLMLLLIISSFLIANRIKKKSSLLLGVLFGLANGLLVTYLLLPVLGGGEGILPTLEPKTPMEGVLGVLQLATRTLLAPLAIVFESLGSWAIVVIILAIVFIAAGSARVSKTSANKS
ncbi:MAG TPA: hypothetical protein G4N94_13670 [Caldilineae bacterium]|nr:hypothetical protein [Caldilineae bacterium]